jgi:hypothetical protein
MLLREMALAVLKQCEARWRAVLASFDKRYEKLIADHPDAKKEMDLVRVSIVRTGQLVQNSPKVNGNGPKWKQLADKAEADRQNLCKFLDGQALFTGVFLTYVATYMQMRGSIQPSSKKSGHEDASQAQKKKKQTPKDRQTLKTVLQQETKEATSNLPKPTAGGSE